MARTICILLILLCCCNKNDNRHTTDESVSSCKHKYDKHLEKYIYEEVDKPPEFPGGLAAFARLFFSRFEYPAAEKSLQRTIYFTFVVNNNGELIDKKIADKTPENMTLIDKEALRVLESMPKWHPGKCNGHTVAVRYFIPLRF